MEQLARVDRNPGPKESADAMAENLHEDKALRIDAKNFEGSQVEDSRAFGGRKGEGGWVDSRRN